MPQHAPDRLLVGIEQQRAEHGLEVLLQREVEHQVERVLAGLGGERGHVALLVVLVRADSTTVTFCHSPLNRRKCAGRSSSARIASRKPRSRSLVLNASPFRPSAGRHDVEALDRIRRAQGEVVGQRAARHRAEQALPARVRVPDRLEIVEHRARVGAVVQQRGDHHRPARERRQRLEEFHLRLPALGEHEHAAPGLAQAGDQRAQLALVGEARGHRHAALAVVRRRGAGGKADRAGAHALEHDAAHGGDLVVARGALGGRFAHDVAAHRRMADEGRHVERRAAALEHVEVLGHGLELPADPGAQHLERHALDLGQVAHHALALGRAAGGDGEAAVADHRAGDAQRRARREPRVPGDLGVVVGVVVDDSRHQGEPLRVERFARRAELAPERGDAPAGHGEVAARAARRRGRRAARRCG